jgi:hypothetical protein
MSAIRTLLQESIDYAGLFPPAGLNMAAAVQNYAQYHTGPDAWALGRFVVPGSLLSEFEAAAAIHCSTPRSDGPWRLSVLGGPQPALDLEAIGKFNQRHSRTGGPFVADTLELKATSPSAIASLMAMIPDGLQPYIENPIGDGLREILSIIARHGGRAKVRTGGITRESFPATTDLLRFIRACIDLGLPFKATAGLHHPLRSEYRLTYAEDSPTAPMFGFLNLFLVTGFLREGMHDSDAVRLLEESSPRAFQMDDDGISWERHRLDREALRSMRQDGMISFGSCSFTEPLSDLEALNLLPRRVQRA